MKDLDFDELDRAVNSLMTDASKAQASTPATEPSEQEKTLDITPTLDTGATPSFDKLNEATAKAAGALSHAAPEQKPEDAPKPVSSTAPPAARRGGRFMDVVHPSASAKKPNVSARVSRQGVTVAPINAAPKAAEPTSEEKPRASVLPDDSSQPKPAEPEIEKPTPLAVPSQPPVETHAAAKSDWPDPLDMAGFKEEKDDSKPSEPKEDDSSPSVTASGVSDGKSLEADLTPTQEADSKKVLAPDSEDVGSETVSGQDKTPEKDQSPLTSPFLSDAKVEKRPLGGSTAPAEIEEPGRAPVLGAASEEKKSINDPAAQLPASPEEVEPELPEELQGDLVAIEADTTTHQQPAPAGSTPVVATEAKEAPVDGEEPGPKPLQPNRDQEEKLVSAGPTSIPQQYREEESTGDKDSGAIYDTETYHQPLAHPDKKKSGWLVVVWIVAILLLGAGGGAALYLLGVV